MFLDIFNLVLWNANVVFIFDKYHINARKVEYNCKAE